MQTTAAPANTTLAADVKDVSFAYGDRPALDQLSLNVPAGSVFGLLGPNGSGKSTLLSLLAGLEAPTDGSVHALGHPPSAELRARMGILFQETTLDPLMTINESLHLHGRLYGLGGPDLRERLDAILNTVGLSDRASDLVKTLSGGMKRRLELGRALLTSPELVLLDEPTTGLDPDSQQALWSHLAQTNREGATVILATNNVGEAEAHCETVAFIHQGRVVAQGSPAELKAGLKHDGVWIGGDFGDQLIADVESWPDVGRLTWAPPILHATVDSAAAFVPRLFQAAGDRITSVRLREATLEDAYFDIVGDAISWESA